jgi:hypothetical protein
VNWQPLLAAPLQIHLHVVAVLIVIVLAPLQLALPKGTNLHRAIGRIWVAAMVLICISAFFILDRPIPPSIGGISWLHGLAVFTLVMLWRAVSAARRGDIRSHKIGMIMLTLLGIGVPLIVAFSMQGRIMHDMVFR